MMRSEEVSRKNMIPSTRCIAIASARVDPSAVVRMFCAASWEREPVRERMAGMARVIARTMITMTTIISISVNAERAVGSGQRAVGREGEENDAGTRARRDAGMGCGLRITDCVCAQLPALSIANRKSQIADGCFILLVLEGVE